MLLSWGLVIGGIALVLFSAGRLVNGTIATARNFGLSAFLTSVVLLGFDPENLAVGAVGSFEQTPGIALGTIVGSAMVAIALALGVTALIVPLHFARAPRRILIVPVLAAGLLQTLIADGLLSRADGVILLVAYGMAIAYLYWLNRRGVDIRGVGFGKSADHVKVASRAGALSLLAVSLAMIVLGSEMLVTGASDLIGRFGLSQTLVGMTLIALAISVEELARELPAALRGHPEVSLGNAAGSMLAFFLFNAGIIALVRPVAVDAATRHFYQPLAIATVVLISAFLLFRRIPRWGGALLLAVYAGFVLGGYLLYGAAPGNPATP